MNTQIAINHLKERGLNIFLNAKVSELPESIFNFSPEQKKKNLCLIGNGGNTLWKNITDFSISNPIDTFSINQMNIFAKSALSNDIEILFPNDNYVLPLQKLGRFFNLSHQSPLGFDISNEFGLWFAFRGVFLTNAELPKSLIPNNLSPCESCDNRPCLSDPDVYKARIKCPVKNEHQYTQKQMEYHQSIVLNLKN